MVEEIHFMVEPTFKKLFLTPVTSHVTIRAVTRDVTDVAMIRTFRHQGLKQLFEASGSRAVAADLTRRLSRQLDYLNRAVSSQDMDLPGVRLHELQDGRKGTWGIVVNGDWRLTFTFRGGDAFDVDLEDYQ